MPSLALTVQEVPNPRKDYGGWVTDMAEIINDSTETELNQMISELEAEKGSEIAVVTVLETQPAATPKEFATKLFNYWGIGKKGEDNGVLFLVSVGDRRVEIDTGKGIQEILPDAKVSNLIDSKIIPEFKSGQFESGIVVGTTELVTSLKTENNKVIKTMAIGSMMYVIIVLLLLFFVINFIWRANKRSNTGSNRSRNRGGNGGSKNYSRSSSSRSNSSSSSSNTYVGGYDSGSSSCGSSDSGGSSFGGGSSDGGGDGGGW